jgi:DNA-binding response OmpR family regulator
MTTILIVDDESDTVTMLTTALKLFGFVLVPAFTGAEAVTLFDQHQPSAVLLDLMLPDIEGYEVARRIRALSPDVPILVLSATADVAAENLSRQAGASHFIRKPVNIRTLAETLKSAIGEA